MIQLRYVKACREGFLREAATVAGPFTGFEAARDAVIRLTPLYPGCRLIIDGKAMADKKALAALADPITERTTPLPAKEN